MVSVGQNLGAGRVYSSPPVGLLAPTLPRDLVTSSLPQLAPENTLMSLRKTAECGAAVFETDVMVR